MPSPRSTPAGHRPGRPRSKAADQAILDAAEALIIERGVASTTFEAIAARAAVARTTLYRRYPTLHDVLIDLVGRTHALQLPIPDLGTVREDLVSMYMTSVEFLAQPRWRRFAAEITAAQAGSPALAETMHRMWDQRRQATTVVLSRGIQRGELRPDIDLELVLDLLTGLARFRLLDRGTPVDRQLIEQAIDTVLSGIAASPPP